MYVGHRSTAGLEVLSGRLHGRARGCRQHCCERCDQCHWNRSERAVSLCHYRIGGKRIRHRRCDWVATAPTERHVFRRRLTSGTGHRSKRQVRVCARQSEQRSDRVVDQRKRWCTRAGTRQPLSARPQLCTWTRSDFYRGCAVTRSHRFIFCWHRCMRMVVVIALLAGAQALAQDDAFITPRWLKSQDVPIGVGQEALQRQHDALEAMRVESVRPWPPFPRLGYTPRPLVPNGMTTESTRYGLSNVARSPAFLPGMGISRAESGF